MGHEAELATLREEVLRLRARLGALQNMREGIQILDRDLTYLYINPAAARHGQRPQEEFAGRAMKELYPGVEGSEMYARLRRCVREGVPDAMDNHFTYPDGTARWFELRMEPVPDGVMVLSIDVEDQKRLQEQLRHAHKMEAIGRMAGGVAHDFNNLLTVITSYADFLATELEHPELLSDLQQIQQAAERGAALTRQLLTMSRGEVTEPITLALDDAVAELAPMLGRMVGEDVEVSIVRESRVQVRIDPGHLDQVLLNLAGNASDAMPEGGRLTVRTDQVRLDEPYTDVHFDVEPGAYAMVSVTDTGTGMDAPTIARIFEPFYSTKDVGRGHGLGLATSYAIVKQANGHIWVYSEPGQGTTFKVYLPIAQGAPEPVAPEPELSEELRGTQTVLVVDDEPALRALCVRALAAYGYTVLGADGPDEALRFAERYSGLIHAVVTDVAMPGMRGPRLVEQLRNARPGLRALYMSGYADDHTLAAIDATHHLEKPFTPDQLARALRDVLTL